jgi:hypothetical protein
MQVKDLTDGRYLISFTPEESGEYVVSALVNGDEIPQDQELQASVQVRHSVAAAELTPGALVATPVATPPQRAASCAGASKCCKRLHGGVCQPCCVATCGTAVWPQVAPRG